MKILIPHLYNVPGGVEMLTLSLVRELSTLAEQVVLVVPRRSVGYFKAKLPDSGKIAFETYGWRDKDAAADLVYSIFLKAHRFLLLFLKGRIEGRIRFWKFNRFLRKLAGKYGVTHCLYMIASGQKPPTIGIPLFLVVPDLYWHHEEHRYSRKHIRERDENLIEWGVCSQRLFPISREAGNDIFRYIPAIPADKVCPIQIASEVFAKASRGNAEEKSVKKAVYYPAGFRRQKNHLLVFKAAYALAEKGYDLEVVLSGHGVGMLVSDDPVKYSPAEECRRFYQGHKDRLSGVLRVMGYLDIEEVEELYSRCSFVILPSTFEGYGLPLAEAVSRGKHVICSDIPVFREQVELYGIGDMVHFFPVNDLEAFTALIEKFLNDPPPAPDMDEIRRKFSKWTWKQVARKYIEAMLNPRC